MSVPFRIALISCSKTKAANPLPARKLYNSDLFRKALAYATQPDVFDAVYILSAQHALVRLDEEIAPYDLTLRDLSPEERRRWARRVWASLATLHRHQSLRIDFLAGVDYAKPLCAARAWADILFDSPAEVELRFPLHRLQIGDRKRWLKLRGPLGEEAAHG